MIVGCKIGFVSMRENGTSSRQKNLIAFIRSAPDERGETGWPPGERLFSSCQKRSFLAIYI